MKRGVWPVLSERARRVLGVLVSIALLGWKPLAVAAEERFPRMSLSSGIAQTVSHKCGSCHSPEFSLWARHPHSHFLVDPAKDPRRLFARWGEDVEGWKEHAAERVNRRDIALAYGVLQIQIYFRRDGDGHRLLPAQWNIAENRWEQLPLDLENFRRASATWEEQCAGCHTTGFNPSDGTFTEANTGCEACHGDAASHMGSGGRSAVLRLSALNPARRTEICGSCHSRGKSRPANLPYPVWFSPGSTLSDVWTLETPEPGKITELFWPEGTERMPFMEYQAFLQSGHGRAGLSCTTCHLPHGSENPHGLRRKTADICRGCHAEPGAPGPVHRSHPADKASCVECHMSVINAGSGQARVRTHTFRFLEPGLALETGMPESCTGECHADRNPRWAKDKLDSWRQQ